jgi:hypothetical protein
MMRRRIQSTSSSTVKRRDEGRKGVSPGSNRARVPVNRWLAFFCGAQNAREDFFPTCMRGAPSAAYLCILHDESSSEAGVFITQRLAAPRCTLLGRAGEYIHICITDGCVYIPIARAARLTSTSRTGHARKGAIHLLASIKSVRCTALHVTGDG